MKSKSISQSHSAEMKGLRRKIRKLEIEILEKNEHCSEILCVKQENIELRAKVLRQDAAWKRKMESERRRGHSANKMNARGPLEDCTEKALVPANTRIETGFERCSSKCVGLDGDGCEAGGSGGSEAWA